MNLDEEDLQPFKTTLIAFNGQNTKPKGYIDLRLTLGTKEAFKSERVRFIVADFPSSYNVIIGRPTIHKWDMAVSTKHQKLKIVSNKNKIITICGDQEESRRCYFDTVQGVEGTTSSPPRIREGDKPVEQESRQKGKAVNMVELDMREEAAIPRPESEGELEEVQIGDDPGQKTKIGKMLNPAMKANLTDCLTNNRDVFAWKSTEIPGIDPGFCCHKLSIHPGSKPVAQKKRKLGPERRQVLEDHVKDLLEAGFIREIQYTT